MSDLNALLYDRNPFVAEGMKRRLSQAEAPLAPVEVVDPYAGHWLAEATRSHLQRTANYVPAFEGLGRKLVGDEAGATEAFERYRAGEERAAQLGPRVQSFDQAESAGDYASAAAYQALGFAPDIALSLTGAGLGAVAGRQVAKGAVRRSIAGELRDFATQRGVAGTQRGIAGAQSGLRDEAGDAAATQLNREINQRSRNAALRTPRDAQILRRATVGGRVVGAATGQFPGLNTANVEVLAVPETTQTDAAKALAGTVAASALGTLPFERFFGRFGTAATQAVTAQAGRYLPRVAREFAKQGLAEGSAEVAQTATQLASHRWIDENVDLLGPEALNQYFASAVGGFLAGGALGGAGEAGRGAARALAVGGRRVAQVAGDVRGRVREALGAAGDRARKAWTARGMGQVAPGTELGAGGPDTAAPRSGAGTAAGAGRRFQDALQTVRGWGRAATESTRRWRDVSDQVQYEQDLDADTDEVLDLAAHYDAGEAPLTPLTQRPTDNPVRLQSRWQNALMASIDHRHPLWQNADDARRTGATLEKVLFGHDLAPVEVELLSDLTAGDTPALDPRRLKLWEAAAPTLAANEAALRRFGTADEDMNEDADETAPGADLTETAAEAEGRSGPGDINVRGRDAIGTSLPAMRIATAIAAGRTVRQRLTALTDAPADAATRTELTAELDRLRAEHTTAQTELRTQILGPVRDKNPFGANVFVKNASTPAAAAQFDTRVKQPGRVVLADPVDIGKNKPLLRDAALGVDTLVAQRLAQLSDQFGSDDDGQRDLRQAATVQAFADLSLAGIRIRPTSITPGRLYVGQGAQRRLVGELTPRMVRQLRQEFRPSPGRAVRTDKPLNPSERWTEQPGRIDRSGESGAPSVLAQRIDTRAPMMTRKDTARRAATAVKTQALGEGDFEVDADRRLLPRQAPEGRRAPDGIFVPTLDVVTDVQWQPSPYEANVAAARRARRSGQPPAKVRTSVHAEGVKIGEAELKKQRDNGAMTERRYQQERKRLQDFDSGLSRKYLNDAAAGKFDTARVVEARVAKDTVDQKAAAKEARKYGVPDDVDVSESPNAPVSPGTKGERALAQTQFDRTDDTESSDEARGGDFQFNKAIDAGLKATRAPGARTLKKEQRMLNAVLDRLGIKQKIIVTELDATPAKHNAGAYLRATHTIAISPRLKGAERVEVLMHELGHHLVWTEVSRAAGIEFGAVAELDDQQAIQILRDKNPKLFAALKTDYDAWRVANPHRRKIGETRASRAPLHRGLRYLQLAAVRPETSTELSPDQLAYQYDFHEWVADNIARALTQKSESTDIVGQFFKRIVQQLRKAYALVFKRSAHAQWTPASSVDVWIQSLFDANTQAVGTALQRTVSRRQAKTAVKAAAANALGAAPAGAAGADRGGGSIGAGPPRGRGYDPAQDPDAWNPDPPALIAFVREVMTPQTRQILDRVFNRGVLVQRLRHVYAQAPELLALLDDAKAGLENRIALGYLAWRHGRLAVGPQGRSALFDVTDDLAAIFDVAMDGDYAQRILSDMANGAIARFHNANKTYDVRQLEARSRGTLNRVLDRIGDARGKIGEPFSRFVDSKFKRMWASGVPAARELAALLQRPQGATGEDRGLLPAIVHTTARYGQRAQRTIVGLSPKEAARALQMMQRQITPGDPTWRGNAKVERAVKDIRTLLDEAFDYMKAAGVEVGRREHFFPIVFDLRNAALKTQLTKLYSRKTFEPAIRRLFGKNRQPSRQTLDVLVKNLVDGATALDGLPPAAASGVPNFRGANYRLSQFIYAHGSPADIKIFARMQSKQPTEIFARYFEPMVRRAEYARRFGDDGAGLDKLLNAMRQQKAAPADIALARDAVHAALGMYGADGSPVLRMLSPALATRFSGPRSKAFVQGMQAYQNARLLPLATLSSLVDPMGIAVRTGGDFKTAWDGWKVGVKSIFSPQTRREVHQMLAMLGATEDMATIEALQAGFGGTGNPTARSVNHFVFKWNGLQAWTRATRYMALVSAHGFLLKHAAGKNDQSRRYLAELGLQPDDIHTQLQAGQAQRVGLLPESVRSQLQATTKGTSPAAPAARDELARDDRVRNALSQFVDEAILRPNSQQTPLWHSDPYMGLVTQYKAFAYAIYDQIGGRIGREFQHGNLRVLLPAMAYVPVVVLIELLRELIQYGTDGNKYREGWGPDDYLKLGVDKSGLLGPQASFATDLYQDVQRGRTAGASQTGPALGQLRNAWMSHDAGKTLEDALPTSAAWKRWNDQPTAGVQSNG